jgi:hypothetical protein
MEKNSFRSRRFALWAIKKQSGSGRTLKKKLGLTHRTAISVVCAHKSRLNRLKCEQTSDNRVSPKKGTSSLDLSVGGSMTSQQNTLRL